MKKLLIVLSALAIMPACKKDEGTTTINLPIIPSNLVGVYKITAISFTVSGTSAPIDAFGLLPACFQDDTHEFTAANVYTNIDAGVTCTPPTPTTSSSYTFTGTTATFGGNNYTVESLTQTGTKVNMVVTRTGTHTFNGTTLNGTSRTTFSR